MNRIRGSISLFAAMIFLILISLITTTILSARAEGAEVMVKTSASMALDSVFSCYDTELFSEFGILLLDGKMGGEEMNIDRVSAEVTDYMSYNIDTHKELYFAGNTDLYGIELSGVTADSVLTATGAGGLYWFNEAVDYEKYAKPIDLAAEYLGLESADAEAQAVNEINDGITECSQMIITVSDQMKKIVEKTDGIKCCGGIDFENVEQTGENYVKCFATDLSSDGIGVKDNRIYMKTALGCYDGYKYFSEAWDDYCSGNKSESCNKLSKVRNNAKNSLNATEDVLKEIDSINGLQDGIDVKAAELKNSLQSKSDIISDEGIKSIGDDLDKISGFRDELSEEILNIETFYSTLSSNKTILSEIIDTIDKIDFSEQETEESDSETETETDDESSEKDDDYEKFEHIKECLDKYTVSPLVINYDYLGEGTEDTGILDSIKAFLEDGIVGLVAPADKVISHKSIKNITGLASSSCSEDEAAAAEKADGGVDKSAKKIIYSEYVMDHFDSFTDDGSDGSLDYEVEYIIAGESSDIENMTETILKLAALRSGPNMLCIMTDSEKKDEAYALASTLVGFTGVDAAVRIVQYAIMYLWSYAEGLSDVKTLLGGGKVPLKKTKDTWNLSLENLLSCQISSASEANDGLDYETYLKFMIYMENDGRKSAYSMDIAELRMMQKGYENFRMKDYIYGMKVTTSYKIKGLDYSFTCEDVCKY